MTGGEKGGEVGTKSRTERLTKGNGDGDGDDDETATSNPTTDPDGAENGGVAKSRDGDGDRTNDRGLKG